LLRSPSWVCFGARQNKSFSIKVRHWAKNIDTASRGNGNQGILAPGPPSHDDEVGWWLNGQLVTCPMAFVCSKSRAMGSLTFRCHFGVLMFLFRATFNGTLRAIRIHFGPRLMANLAGAGLCRTRTCWLLVKICPQIVKLV